MMLYLRAVSGLLSASSLTMRARPSYSLASSSSTGAIRWHGPHHSAQKSTSTGTSLARTSSAKVASVTLAVMLFLSVTYGLLLHPADSAGLRDRLRQLTPQAVPDRLQPGDAAVELGELAPVYL